MPNQKKINSSNILKLKIAKESIDIVNFELDTGSIDLAEILSEIRCRIPDSQKSKYDTFFFGKSQEKNKDANCLLSNEVAIVSCIKQNNECLNAEKADPIHEPWLKKLYKQIVKRSHPDKYIDFPIEAIKQKFINVYMDATTALDESNYGLMLLCAYEVEIEISNPSAKKYISNSTNKYNADIAHVKKLMGYQWYHVQEDKKVLFIESYLKSMGYEIDKKDASEIIIARPPLARKRKVGSRPEKDSRFKK